MVAISINTPYQTKTCLRRWVLLCWSASVTYVNMMLILVIVIAIYNSRRAKKLISFFANFIHEKSLKKSCIVFVIIHSIESIVFWAKSNFPNISNKKIRKISLFYNFWMIDIPELITAICNTIFHRISEKLDSSDYRLFWLSFYLDKCRYISPCINIVVNILKDIRYSMFVDLLNHLESKKIKHMTERIKVSNIGFELKSMLDIVVYKSRLLGDVDHISSLSYTDFSTWVCVVSRVEITFKYFDRSVCLKRANNWFFIDLKNFYFEFIDRCHRY